MLGSGLASLVLALVVSIGIAALFVLIAFHAARRFGPAGVVGAWIASSMLLALLIALRLHARQTALGFTPDQTRDTRTISSFVLVSLVALGAAALAVWRHYRRSATLTRRALVSGVAAFFGGGLAFFVVLLLADVFRFVRQ